MSHIGNKNTSWQKVGKWYGEIVGEKGHFFHQTTIIPNSLKLLGLDKKMSILDVACGQGVLARSIPQEVKYLGVDIARGLVEEAKKLDRSKNHRYMISDVTSNIPTDEIFDRAAMILALQNVKEPEKVICQVAKRLAPGGKFLIVINHPCFRIPRQSSWEIDEKTKTQYRRVNRYMNDLEIPVNMHPGKPDSAVTWSYHHPLSDYSDYLFANGFVIEKIEEWTSEKTSVGKASKMENRARDEFPMFMAILAVKK